MTVLKKCLKTLMDKKKTFFTENGTHGKCISNWLVSNKHWTNTTPKRQQHKKRFSVEIYVCQRVWDCIRSEKINKSLVWCIYDGINCKIAEEKVGNTYKIEYILVFPLNDIDLVLFHKALHITEVWHYSEYMKQILFPVTNFVFMLLAYNCDIFVGCISRSQRDMD